MSGSIIQCYGRSLGSGDEQLYDPRHLAVHSYGNVLVADINNGRVELLNPSLIHLGYVTVPGLELRGPSAVHLDLQNHCLYIAKLLGRLFRVRVSMLAWVGRFSLNKISHIFGCGSFCGF